MQRDPMTLLADSLLATCDKDPLSPFYSEECFRQKMMASRRRDPAHAHLVMSRPNDYLLERECEEAIRLAGLTPKQLSVLSARLDGYSFEEIGRACGHTRQGAFSVFCQALKKLAHAFDVYPYAGLSDVYREEVRGRAVRQGFGTMVK